MMIRISASLMSLGYLLHLTQHVLMDDLMTNVVKCCMMINHHLWMGLVTHIRPYHTTCSTRSTCSDLTHHHMRLASLLMDTIEHHDRSEVDTDRVVTCHTHGMKALHELLDTISTTMAHVALLVIVMP